jgi:phosphomannomutase
LLIRSISGLRGTVGIDNDGLTAEVVSRYAASFATLNGNKGTIALGYDGRRGGELFYRLCAEAIRLSGCNVLMLGMVPTPTVQMAAEHEDGVVGSIAITASHNPAEWNGMKFIAGSGMFLDAEENKALWAILDGGTGKTVQEQEFGKAIDGAAVVQKHIDAVLNNPFIDIAKIKARKFKVVLDAVNASGSFVHPQLLKSLGVAEVIEVACDGSGVFPHRPEPVPANLTSLGEAVLKHKADIGIAVDPDADRLVLYMNNGVPFIEENTIVLSAEQVLKRSEKGATVVVNLSTTRAVEDIAAMYGAKVVRTAVGEINVAKKMKELGAVIGGEGSGGVILPAVHLGRDSLVGVALAFGALAEFDGTIAEKKAALPQYEIVKSKIDLESQAQVTAILAKVKEKFGSRAVSMNDSDGLRIDFEKSWLHARASNTEPIIRLIAEAPTRKEAQDLLDEANA